MAARRVSESCNCEGGEVQRGQLQGARRLDGVRGELYDTVGISFGERLSRAWMR